MLADPTSTPVPTLLAVVGFPYAALVGIRILLRRHAHGASYGVSLVVFAIAGFLAWLGAEIDLPLTVGTGTAEMRTVEIPLLRTTAELAAASVVSAFLLQVLDLGLRARGRDRLLQFQRIALWLAGVLIGAVAIYQVHFAETLPIRTAVLSIGGASVFIIGLALQSTLGNVFAGYGLQASKVFRKGDFVQLGLPGGNPVVGVVWDSTLSTTRILTRDGQMLVIPNGSLLSKDFLNLNQPNPRLRERVRVGISYEVPPANVKDAAAQILASEPNVLQDPSPNVWLVDYGDSSIVYELVFWIPSYAERDETLDRVRTRLWYSLKDAGIEIPFPIRTIKMSNADEERARAAAGQSRLDAAVATLRSCPLFDDRVMVPPERRELARAAIECSFTRGEHVVRRGEESDAMFVVVEGACAVILPNGERIALGPGAHFGEIALLTGERRTADVVADAERTYLLRLPKASVEPVLARRPEFQTRVEAIARERREAALGPGEASANREEGSGFVRALLRLIRPF